MKTLFCWLALLGSTSLVAQTCGFDALRADQFATHPADAVYFQHFRAQGVSKIIQQQQQPGRDHPQLTVPIVFHILHNGEAEGSGQNLSTARIQAQLAELNAAFSATNTNYGDTPAQWQAATGNAHINFCLAVNDPDGDDDDMGITRQQMAVTGSSWNQNNIDSQIKPALAWDPTRYVNVYVLNIPGTTAQGGVVGYAHYPTPNNVGTSIDGLVVDYNWLGGPGFSQSGYNTLVHEMGHYLGLLHPFDGDACNADDGLSDTPNMSEASVVMSCANGYPSGPNTCGEEHMYVNYMDYSSDECYTSFTQQQIALMRAVLDGTTAGLGYASRAGLLDHAPAACNIPAVDAELAALLAPTENQQHCAVDSIYPRVVVRNAGTTALTSSELYVTVDFNLPYIINWTGNLAFGETDTFDLPPVLYFPGPSYYEVVAYTANGQFDGNFLNGFVSANFTTQGGRPLPYTENVEGESGFPLMDSDLAAINVGGDNFVWQITPGVNGPGPGDAALVFPNGAGTQSDNPYGSIDALIIPTLQLKNLNNPELQFDVAYAPYDATFSDTLRVVVALGCAGDFDQPVYEKGGTTLATAPAQPGGFTPGATQWRTETIGLADFVDAELIRIALINRSFWGNNLYIDNIRVVERSCDLEATISSTAETAVDANDGTATVTATNGTGPYGYTWNTGATTAGIGQLAPGDYSVTVVDTDDCQVVVSTTVAAFVCTSFSVNLSTQPVACFGAADGSITSALSGNGTAPYTYLWSTGATGTQLADLPTGDYSLTVTDATGCTAGATVSLTGPAAPLTVSASAQAESSLNGQNGSATAVADGPGANAAAYLWDTGATTAAVDNLAPGTYCVTVTSPAGCTAAACTEVAAYVCPNLVVTLSATTLHCAADADALISTSITGGTAPYTYDWSDGSNGAQLSDLGAGDYALTVTDAAGCTSTASTTIVAPAALVLAITATDETQNDADDGTLMATATGGTAPLSYLWNTGATTSALTQLPPGSYQLTVTDANGCTISGAATIQSFGCALTLTTTSVPTSCTQVSDGSATVTATGAAPFDYAWSTGATTATIGPMLAGTYTVTVTDADNCVATGSATIGTEDLLAPTIVATGGTAVIDGSGVATLDAATLATGSTDNCGGALTYQVTPDAFTCGDEGTHGVLLRVTDAAGNFDTVTVEIVVTNDLAFTHTIVAEPSCADAADGEVLSLISGGLSPYALQYPNGASTGANLPGGAYAVTATDANGCSTVGSFILTAPAPLQLGPPTITDATGNQADGSISVAVSGGTQPYTYQWRLNGGIIVSGAANPTGLAPGSYVLELTDANGCTLVSAPYTVEQLTALATVEDSALRLLPNPASDQVTFTAEVAFRVRLFDLNRRVLYRNRNWQREHRIRVRSLPAGLYLAEVTWRDGRTVHRRVVVQ